MFLPMDDYSNLRSIAAKVRLNSLLMAGTSNGGHLGGTFSCVDLLVYLFYTNLFNFEFSSSRLHQKDFFILSKGHACLAFYSLLQQKNIISQSQIASYFKDGGFGAQLDVTVPGVNWNTGSLGHSLSICAGVALSQKSTDKRGNSVTVIGDSELMEGSIWEGIIFAGNLKISNLWVIIDHNKLSVTTRISDNNKLYKNLSVKMDSFGWAFFEVDGHSMNEIDSVFRMAINNERPKMILAHTIKGRGVSFMEGNPFWHHSRPSNSQFFKAIEELKRSANG